MRTRRSRTWHSPKDVNATSVSRVLRLTLLAPEVVDAIIDGRQPAGLQLDDQTATGAAGFGTTVLQKMTESVLSGDVRIEYAPEGVVWQLRCPLAALHDNSGKDASI